MGSISRLVEKEKGDLRSPYDECKGRLYVVKDHNNMQSLKFSIILLCYQNATILIF